MADKHPAVAYCHGVLDGTIPAGALIRQAVERHLRDLETGKERGLWFDRNAAQFAIDFFGFLKHSKGEWAGQPFELAPWQQFIIWNLFGWKRENGFRRFGHAYVEVPRKNGKSTLAAGIGLYMLAADGESGAEIYSAATKRDQAKIVWGEASEMVKKSPSLHKMIELFKSSNTLMIQQTASKFQPLGADEDSLDGLNPHGASIDEVHAHASRKTYDALDTGTGARRQPLIFEITTAGNDQASLCFEHHEYSRKLLDGSIEDDDQFAFIASMDEGDDWTDPAVWAKANPGLGVSVRIEVLEDEARKAMQMPAQQNTFRQMHLNQWTQQSTRWINLLLWDENAGALPGEPELREKALAGRAGYGALDLSAVSDLTAWVMGFPDPHDAEALDVLCRFWAPEAKLHDATNRYMDQYRAWAKQGYLQVTPGDAIDYGFIKKQILEDAKRFRLISMNVDRLFQGYQLSQELADEGLDVFGMGQGFLSMAAPMKEFERRMLGKKLHHGGNPVLRFMADNVAVQMDPAGNLKPDKAKSQGRIDGIVAMVMMIDRAMRHEPPKTSVYERRGLVVA
jgi:phage terminase large subunit-like protein